jgi:hypothetical protein
MNIYPRPDQALAIQEAIRAGLIKSETDALDIGLESLRARLVERLLNDVNEQTKMQNLVNVFAPIRGSGIELSRTPQEAVAHIREIRKENVLPHGVTIHDLINEGRA